MFSKSFQIHTSIDNSLDLLHCMENKRSHQIGRLKTTENWVQTLNDGLDNTTKGQAHPLGFLPTQRGKPGAPSSPNTWTFLEKNQRDLHYTTHAGMRMPSFQSFNLHTDLGDLHFKVTLGILFFSYRNSYYRNKRRNLTLS